MTDRWRTFGAPALAAVTIVALCLGALGFFVYWYPILSAAPLDDPQDFLKWAWTEGWR